MLKTNLRYCICEHKALLDIETVTACGVMCNALWLCALLLCLGLLSFCWSDIESGCLSHDHHYLHLSQLTMTAFGFLMSTSISWLHSIAHVPMSKTACGKLLEKFVNLLGLAGSLE